MLGRLLLLARGQVRVRVTGASLPRFLNLCAFHSLTLRRMKRTAWNELYATMSVADFRALRRYMGRTGCRVHIVRRRGAPFTAARLRPRYALWGGFLLLVLVCFMLCTRVWSIETDISPALDEAEVMQQLDDLGVHIGARIGSINTRSIRWKILQLQPNMTFFALNIRGNSVTIQADGAQPPGAMLDQDAVVKVVAERDQERARAGRAGGRPGGGCSAGGGYADQRAGAADPRGRGIPPDPCARRGRGLYPAHGAGGARPDRGGKALHRQGAAAVRPHFGK